MEKLKLTGTGNKERRSYFILSKEQRFFSLFPIFLMNCGFKNIGIYEDYQEGTDIATFKDTIEHMQNEDYDIDIVYTSDKIILIVRTDADNREKLLSAIKKIADSEEIQ